MRSSQWEARRPASGLLSRLPSGVHVVGSLAHPQGLAVHTFSAGTLALEEGLDYWAGNNLPEDPLLDRG